MHQLPILVALLISFVLGAVTTAMVAGLEVPAAPPYGVF